jgi:hypothetical protein
MWKLHTTCLFQSKTVKEGRGGALKDHKKCMTQIPSAGSLKTQSFFKIVFCKFYLLCPRPIPFIRLPSEKPLLLVETRLLEPLLLDDTGRRVPSAGGR